MQKLIKNIIHTQQASNTHKDTHNKAEGGRGSPTRGEEGHTHAKSTATHTHNTRRRNREPPPYEDDQSKPNKSKRTTHKNITLRIQQAPFVVN